MKKSAESPENGEITANHDGTAALFAEERRAKIAEFLEREGKVTVKNLCELFGVSSGTARNDLNEMDSAGLLTRTHGGAIPKTKAGFEPDTTQRETQNLRQKARIGAATERLVEDGDTIILDAGTTTLELAKQLHRKRNLCVVTNDMRIAGLLEENTDITLLLVGGQLRNRFHCTVGTLGTEMLARLTVDKVFLGTNSFSLSRGATSPDIGQVEMRRAMMATARKVILLCDSSKFGRSSFLRIAGIDQIDTLVTDALSDEDRKQLEDQGLEVIVASP